MPRCSPRSKPASEQIGAFAMQTMGPQRYRQSLQYERLVSRTKALYGIGKHVVRYRSRSPSNDVTKVARPLTTQLCTPEQNVRSAARSIPLDDVVISAKLTPCFSNVGLCSSGSKRLPVWN